MQTFKWSKVFGKMTIFGKYNWVLSLSGLDPRGGRRNIFARIAHPVINALFLTSALIFFVSNMHTDTDGALRTLCVIFGHIGFILIYYYLLLHRKRFYSLLAELKESQEIIHKSKLEFELRCLNVTIGISFSCVVMICVISRSTNYVLQLARVVFEFVCVFRSYALVHRTIRSGLITNKYEIPIDTS